MSVAAVDYIQGSSRVFINLPAALQGQFDVFGVGIGRYRLMIIVICGLLTIASPDGAGQDPFRQPRCAPRSMIPAPRAASASTCRRCSPSPLLSAAGSPVSAARSSAEILGLDPYFPLKFMIYFLIVVTVGGSSSITGPFLASLLLGIGDVAGKYTCRRWALRDLHHDDRDPDLAPERPVRPHGRALSPPMSASSDVGYHAQPAGLLALHGIVTEPVLALIVAGVLRWCWALPPASW